MFIDMHVHTAGISHCCLIDYRDNLLKAKQMGYGGVVITNHYTNDYWANQTYNDWIEKYIQEYKNCLEYGKKIGVKTFFGIEVTWAQDKRVHLLIYGADENFIRKNKFLCDKTQKELYEICNQNGCALVQAHPFRHGTTVLDPKYLHGIEINCHPLYRNSFSKEIIECAKKANVAVTVGCDYHADTDRVQGGMFLPDSINSEKQLAQYIVKKQRVQVQVQEPENALIKKFFVNE